jgi:Ca2+-binding EF-hand superfamily protein
MSKIWTACLGGILVSSIALAQGGPENRRGPAMQDRMRAAWEQVDKEACFKALDTDGDGAITQEEFERANMQDVFGVALMNAMRKNAGGKQGQAGKQGAANMFEKMDKNGDGNLSAEEFPRGPEAFEKLAKRADTNGDGLISQDEMQAMREKAKNRAAQGQGRAKPKAQAAEDDDQGGDDQE